ncbi:MAG: HD domain-containing protein [Myxococcales bacterium]|nr:HD domain-containing protein [Myxococcales bacterium]
MRLSWTGSNAYAQHLAAINEQRLIRAASDIYDTDGNLIITKGTPIDYEAVRRLIRHKLTRPLDADIEIDSVLGASSLFRRFHDVLRRFSDVKQAHENLRFVSEFEKIANRMQLPMLVSQKLTVMAIRQPITMDQTLLGAWFAVLVGRELGLEEKELPILYFAAVCRDMGMLHVDAKVLEGPQKGLFNPEEWKALQSHAVVSRMILEECEGLPERLLDAVSQHHENIDGTGYPSNLKDADLGELGQILSIADTIVALRVRKFRGSGRNLRDTQAALQVEVDTYREPVLSAASKVLSSTGLRRTTFHGYSNRQALVRGLYEGAQSLLECAEVLRSSIGILENETSKRSVTIQAYAKRLNHTLARSGLGDGAVVAWLEEVIHHPNDVALVDLTEIDLQQRELLWQFKRLYLNIQGTAERESLGPSTAIGQILVSMQNFLTELQRKQEDC